MLLKVEGGEMTKLTDEERVDKLYEVITSELTDEWDIDSKALINALARCAMRNIEVGRRGEVVNKALEGILRMFEEE